MPARRCDHGLLREGPRQGRGLVDPERLVGFVSELPARGRRAPVRGLADRSVRQDQGVLLTRGQRLWSAVPRVRRWSWRLQRVGERPSQHANGELYQSGLGLDRARRGRVVVCCASTAV